VLTRESPSSAGQKPTSSNHFPALVLQSSPALHLLLATCVSRWVSPSPQSVAASSGSNTRKTNHSPPIKVCDSDAPILISFAEKGASLIFDATILESQFRFSLCHIAIIGDFGFEHPNHQMPMLERTDRQRQSIGPQISIHYQYTHGHATLSHHCYDLPCLMNKWIEFLPSDAWIEDGQTRGNKTVFLISMVPQGGIRTIKVRPPSFFVCAIPVRTVRSARASQPRICLIGMSR
jgi:hypothetical protein